MRLPLIPGCNDGAEDVAAAARFVGSLPNRPEMNLLPYHNLGESKYGMIGETCALSGLESRKGRDPKLLALQELCQRCARTIGSAWGETPSRWNSMKTQKPRRGCGGAFG